jgi:glycolate dehydrogenase FAD-binding subunit
MADDTCCIDGYGPLAKVEPGTIAELGEVVRESAGRGFAVYPLGGGTMLDFGQPPTRPGLAVQLSRFDQVLDYPARDMTITVQTGMTVARLQAILSPENQRLPIDVPRARSATVGGILAANVNGSCRLGHGTLRDYVLGISAINDEGREFKAGGRVVKNVAGYDLCRLLIGSLGTLGIVTQVTLKLRPRAEQQILASISCDRAALGDVLDRLHGSRTRPVCIDVLNPSARTRLCSEIAAVQGPYAVLVGYEGNQDAVKWQLQQLLREQADRHPVDAWVAWTGQNCWEAMIEFPLLTLDDRTLTFKACLPSSATASFCRELDEFSERPLFQAHAENGIVIGHAADLDTDRACRFLDKLRGLAASARGRVVVMRCPSAWKQRLSVWGPSPGSAWLMHEVKNKLDPRGIFNPGRFVDGI